MIIIIFVVVNDGDTITIYISMAIGDFVQINPYSDK